MTDFNRNKGHVYVENYRNKGLVCEKALGISYGRTS